MARDSSQRQGRSPIVTFAIVVVAIGGVVAWRYMPGSMKSGTFLKIASTTLSDHGGESDEEVESRLRDLAIRSSLSMGDDAVEIKRPDDKHAVVSFTRKNEIPTTDFRLFYDIGDGKVSTRVLSYRPRDNEDGFFLLLASPEI